MAKSLRSIPIRNHNHIHRCSQIFSSSSSSSSSSSFSQKEGAFRNTIEDITGFNVKVRDQKHLAMLNEIIMNTITMESDSIDNFHELVAKDSDCAMTKLLILFEMLRHGSCIFDRCTVGTLLSDIDVYASKGLLNHREAHLALAALHWSKGRLLRAAQVLEESFRDRPVDCLALKLAQDAYFRHGSSSLTFACVARTPDILNTAHPQHGILMGMKALGHLANRRWTEAEDVARRAVSITSKKDLNSITALLLCYQLSGRTSEISAAVDEHNNHHNTIGQHVLLYHLALSLAQRGNYSGAINTFDHLVAHADLHPQLLPQLTFIHATLTLWYVSLHSVEPEYATRWRSPSYIRCWNRIAKVYNMYDSPLLEVCRTMAIFHLSKVSHVDVDNISSMKINEEISLPTDNTTTVNVTATGTETSDATTSTSSVAQAGRFFMGMLHTYEKMRSDSRSATTSQRVRQAEALPVEPPVAVSMQEHFHRLENLAMPKNDQKERVESSKSLYPSLDALESQLIVRARSERLWDEDDGGMSRRSSNCSLPVSKAVLAFLEGNRYADAASLLSSPDLDLSLLGGSVVDRDTVEFTLIEALLREDSESSRWEAQRLLTERVVLRTNEAQSWRRLASLFGRSGKLPLAQLANYTSWQLGIGQGGFGGPK